MLHVPTCKIFCIKQQPLNSRDSRNGLKEWLGFWQSKLGYNNPSHFVQIYDTFWNTPQGCVSILEQFCPNGSLQNLIQFYYDLPEQCLKQVAEQTLIILQEMNKIADQGHGGLLPSQILFTKQGTIKLSQGRGSKVKGQVSAFALSYTKFSDKINLYQSFYINKKNLWAKLSKDSDPDSSQDIYSLGMILLFASLGGFGMVQKADYMCQKARGIFNSGRADSVCCLLHFQDQFQGLTFKKFMRIKFSKVFQSFLCRCLQISAKKRASISQLLAHPFIKQSTNKIPIGLNELIRTYQYDKQIPGQIKIINKGKLTKLCNSIKTVLQKKSYNKQEVKQSLLQGSLQQLMKQVGCIQKEVMKQISSVYRL